MTSFVDMLFILLFAVIVAFSDSFQVGAIEMSPARVGAGGVSEVRADEVRMIVVNTDNCQIITDSREPVIVKNMQNLTKMIAKDRCLLITVANDKVPHHRVMQVWSACHKAGYTVKLAAISEDEPVKKKE
jgi:biopolymer transport protein ExbD